jgi:DNA-binding NarL/FixJ family response regulator
MNADFLARKSRVFVVDDHPLVRDGLSTLINQESDLEVCGIAEDAISALPAIAASRPHIALIDISLKNTSGLELIKDLKIQQPSVALIVVSMHDEMLYAERALRAGARGYIMKRETTRNVLTAIRRVLEGGVYLSDNVVTRMASLVAGQRQRESISAERVERLSDRELEIFRLLGRGLATSEIASILHINFKTIQAYCARAATRWEDQHGAATA